MGPISVSLVVIFAFCASFQWRCVALKDSSNGIYEVTADRKQHVEGDDGREIKEGDAGSRGFQTLQIELKAKTVMARQQRRANALGLLPYLKVGHTKYETEAHRKYKVKYPADYQKEIRKESKVKIPSSDIIEAEALKLSDILPPNVASKLSKIGIAKRIRRTAIDSIPNNLGNGSLSNESQSTPECLERFSCRGKCTVMRAFQTNDTEMCFCDVFCDKFGDCCPDYEDTCTSRCTSANDSLGEVDNKRDALPASESTNRTNSSSCIRADSAITKEDGGQSFWKCVGPERLRIWMITKCPENSVNDKDSAKCAKPVNSSNLLTTGNYRWSIPVYTPDGTVYRNRYCARCHGRTLVRTYKVAFECNATPPPSYSSNRAMMFLLTYCSSASWQPMEKQPRRYCPVLKSPCPNDAPLNASKQCAAAQTRIVFGTKNATYKNIVCTTACNRDRAIRCSTAKFSGGRKWPKPPGIGPDINGQPVAKPSVSTAMDFSLIFDFDEDDQEKEIVKVECPILKPIFDPYLEECRVGFVPSPKLAPFDAYRFCLRILIAGAEMRYLKRREFLEFAQHNMGLRESMLTNLKLKALYSDSQQMYIKFDLIFQFAKTPEGHIDPRLRKLFQFTEPISFKMNDTNFVIFKISNRLLSCVNLEKYQPHEYTVLPEFGSAVYINKSQELLQSRDYYNGTGGEILVCGRRFPFGNCTGGFIQLKRGEYTIRTNSSILVLSSKRTYTPKNYFKYKKTVWLCVDYPTFYRQQQRRQGSAVLVLLTYISMLVSIVSLVFVLLTYGLFAELRSPPGINLMNFCTAVLLGQLLWIVGSGQTGNFGLCAALAILLHYLFLVCFVWSSVIAFETWRAFSAGSRHRLASDSRPRKLMHSLRCMAVGWLSAILYVAICVALDLTQAVEIGYTNYDLCWIIGGRANLYFFGVPVAASLCFNAVFYALTVRAIHATSDQAKLINHVQNRQRFGIYVRIGSLMGFTWIFGFCAAYGLGYLWYPFVVLNGLEGLYIAVAFGLSRRARKMYKDLMKGRRSIRGKKHSKRSSSSGRRDKNTKSSLLSSRKNSEVETQM